MKHEQGVAWVWASVFEKYGEGEINNWSVRESEKPI